MLGSSEEKKRCLLTRVDVFAMMYRRHEGSLACCILARGSELRLEDDALLSCADLLVIIRH